MRIGKILGVWTVIASLLFWNGVLGLGLLVPLLGRDAAEMMTLFIALIVIFGAARPFLLAEPEASRAQAIRIGLLWMTLTLTLELGLGRLALVTGAPVTPRFGMWDGSFWPLIVLATGAAPIRWLRRPAYPLPGITK